jgi:hypothetical protein
MNKASVILEKIARMKRAVRLRRHAEAIAEAVRSMSQMELIQLRESTGAVVAPGGGSTEGHAEPSVHTPDDLLEALSAMSVERQLNSKSALVRIRYIARWLVHVIHLAVGEEEPKVRGIYLKAVTILRAVQDTPESPVQRSWFISSDKKVS